MKLISQRRRFGKQC